MGEVSVSKLATFVLDGVALAALMLRPRDGGVESALEHLAVGIEASDLTYPIGIGLISGLGNEADELGIFDEDAVSLGEMLDGGVDVVHGRDAEVGDVHTDLGAAVGEDADGFDAVEATVGGADVAGDGTGGGDVGLLKVDVVGDEEAAGAHGRGSGGGVELRAADVGAARGVAEGSVAETFKLAAANVFEEDAVGARGGGSVKVDGDAIATPDEETSLAGEDGAVGEGGSADGDKGDDVGGADAGMDAVLGGEVDQLGGFACGADGGFDDSGGRAGEGDDGAVVGGIEGPVEQAHAFDLCGGDDLCDLGGVGAFREVGDALDDGFWVHGVRLLGLCVVMRRFVSCHI
jgi:hypothetical protein